jgi:hypothetical protein
VEERRTRKAPLKEQQEGQEVPEQRDSGEVEEGQRKKRDYHSLALKEGQQRLVSSVQALLGRNFLRSVPL